MSRKRRVALQGLCYDLHYQQTRDAPPLLGRYMPPRSVPPHRATSANPRSAIRGDFRVFRWRSMPLPHRAEPMSCSSPRTSRVAAHRAWCVPSLLGSNRPNHHFHLCAWHGHNTIPHSDFVPKQPPPLLNAPYPRRSHRHRKRRYIYLLQPPRIGDSSRASRHSRSRQ